MVNSATGDAPSASMPIVLRAGSQSSKPVAVVKQPRKIAQGSGFFSTPFSALPMARETPCSLAPSSRDSAMHSDEVTIMSIASATMAGPAARWPSSATSSGTPMKPEFGNAATRAPKDASFQPTAPRRVVTTVSATISSAHSR